MAWDKFSKSNLTSRITSWKPKLKDFYRWQFLFWREHPYTGHALFLKSEKSEMLILIVD